MNYTKGEWKVTDSAFARCTIYRGKKHGGRTFVTIDLNQIAEVQGNTQEEAEANANLIAAAPLGYELAEFASRMSATWIEEGLLEIGEGDYLRMKQLSLGFLAKAERKEVKNDSST